MEIFLFLALFFIYVLTALTVPALIVKRMWIIGFILSFVLTAVAIMFISTSRQTVLMQESELNWYYFLYLFGSISVILGFINLWIYRKELYHILLSHDTED